MRLSKLTAQYLDYQSSYNKLRSVQNVKGISARLLRFFGDRELSRLTEEDVMDFIELRRKTVKDVSVNHDLTILKGLLRFAVHRGHLDKMPFRIRMLRVDKKKNLPVLTKEQLRSLIDIARGPNRWILLLAACSGMRTGEILHLQWRDVDWDSQSVLVTAKDDWSPKSHQTRRIFVSQEFLDWLSRFREVSSFHRDKHYIFATRNGTPVDSCNLMREMRQIFKDVGLYLKGRPLLHWIRHSVCSTLLANGCDIETTRQILGHASWVTTEKYAHTTDERMKLASTLLEL